MMEDIEIEPQSKQIFYVPDGYGYKLITGGEDHRRRVRIRRKGKIPTGEFAYTIENHNDSPVYIKIVKNSE